MEAAMKENKMATMPVNKLLLSMAVPMMISMLVQALYNVVDSIFVANYSQDCVTAIALVFPLHSLMIACGSGVGRCEQHGIKRYRALCGLLCAFSYNRSFRRSAVYGIADADRKYSKRGFCIFKICLRFQHGSFCSDMF